MESLVYVYVILNRLWFKKKRMRVRTLKQAASRPYNLNFDRLDARTWNMLETAPCAFCGSNHREKRDLRNIAVLSRAAPISANNVAPCCPLCWATRAGMTVAELSDRAGRIVAYAGSDARARAYRKVMAQDFAPTNTGRFSRDMRRRDKRKCRGKSKTDYVWLARELGRFPCWYCGDKATGADRIDSLVCPGYAADNVVPCCTMCNSMKHVLPRGTFLRHMQHLAAYSRAAKPNRALTSLGAEWAASAAADMARRTGTPPAQP